MKPEEFEERLQKKARYIASLVQGSQALEGAALDAAGYDRLVQLAVELLRSGPPEKVFHEDSKTTQILRNS